MSHLSHHYSSTLTLPLPDRPKLSTLLFYSVLHQTILLVKGEPLGGKGLTGPHLVVVEATSRPLHLVRHSSVNCKELQEAKDQDLTRIWNLGQLGVQNANLEKCMQYVTFMSN